MNGDQSVVAQFGQNAPDLVTLKINKEGTGSGTVTSSPAGINCGLTCESAFPKGTTVILTPTADPGSVFDSWGGPPCSIFTICSAFMDMNYTVSAVFKQ
jgi:hypothetical protein